jgi:hypothetical protein
MRHFQHILKMTSLGLSAMLLCALAAAQTPAPVPQTVVFEVPVDITHPANVVVMMGCRIEDGGHTSLAKNLVPVPLTAPTAPAATVRDTLVVRVGVALGSHQVDVAKYWQCQMMRGEGLSPSSSGTLLPTVTGDKLLSTLRGSFP